jgi:hypothetical protein
MSAVWKMPFAICHDRFSFKLTFHCMCGRMDRKSLLSGNDRFRFHAPAVESFNAVILNPYFLVVSTGTLSASLPNVCPSMAANGSGNGQRWQFGRH